MNRNFWIYSDGSGVTSGIKSGSYAAMIIDGSGKANYVAGACCPTTNNRMEMTAIIAALVFIRQELGEVLHDNAVTIVTDSQITAGIIDGSNVAKKNLDLCAQLDYLKSGFESLSVLFTKRNSELPQNQADAMCHILRSHFEHTVKEMIELPEFESLTLNRDSIECPKNKKIKQLDE